MRSQQTFSPALIFVKTPKSAGLRKKKYPGADGEFGAAASQTILIRSVLERGLQEMEWVASASQSLKWSDRAVREGQLRCLHDRR